MSASDILILALCGAGVGLAYYLHRKWNTPATPPYDHATAVEITRLMTGILSALGEQVGVLKPYDAYEVWHPPSRVGNAWQYHARGVQIPNALLDAQSLEDYVKDINRRAIALDAPIRVSAVRPEGRSFVYDVVF